MIFILPRNPKLETNNPFPTLRRTSILNFQLPRARPNQTITQSVNQTITQTLKHFFCSTRPNPKPTNPFRDSLFLSRIRSDIFLGTIIIPHFQHIKARFFYAKYLAHCLMTSTHIVFFCSINIHICLSQLSQKIFTC